MSPQTQPQSQQTHPKHLGRPPKSASQHKQPIPSLPSITEEIIVPDYEFFPQSPQSKQQIQQPLPTITPPVR